MALLVRYARFLYLVMRVVRLAACLENSVVGVNVYFHLYNLFCRDWSEEVRHLPCVIRRPFER